MPHTKAAIKSLKQSSRRREKNRAAEKRLKDLRKQIARAVAAKQKDKALEVFKTFQKFIDKNARSSHFIHRNTAARTKSRLMAAINKVTAK